MEITSKGRYAVRVMIELAQNENFISISEISKHQGISVKYLEKIISQLHKANLVTSTKGLNGGYKLNKKPSQISIKEILDATDNKIEVAPCLENKDCPRIQNCTTVDVWQNLNNLIIDYLQKTTLDTLINTK